MGDSLTRVDPMALVMLHQITQFRLLYDDRGALKEVRDNVTLRND